ncbi:MAG: O-linked N-acetylglucosamine transferase, SPINDLY family protein [Ferrovibrionaceae bacterium]
MTGQSALHLSEAEARYRALLALDPRAPVALIGLAGVAAAVGRFDVAATLVVQASERGGPLPAIWREVGVARFLASDPAGAYRLFAISLALDPADPETLYDIGVIRRDAGDTGTALRWLGRAAQVQPAHRHAAPDMADLLRRQDRRAEAEATLRQFLAHEPAGAIGWYNSGVLHGEVGRHPAARQAYRRAIAVSPEHAVFHFNAGCLAAEERRHGSAADHFRRALVTAPDHAQAWNNLGVALREQSCHEDALPAFRRAHQSYPAYHQATSNLLLTLTALDGGQADAMAKAWGAQFSAAPLARPALTGGRRLRIGYLSPDLRRHSCAFFLEPLFAAHDRSAVEIFAYADIDHADETSLRLSALVEHWRQVGRSTDDVLAATIANDSIDILVDLAGHTARNRLPLFGRRLAPVQVSWLGYNATTGLSQIDWRLVDARIRPPPSREWFAEGLWPLDLPAHCWRPPADAPEPADRTPDPRAIVFGSFNALHKLGDRTLRVWSRILRQVPGSRLLLKGGGGDDPATRARIFGGLVALGLDPDRVSIAGWSPDPRSHLALYGEVDLALDPFPYNGTTTTCEALWMGVPVLTLKGDRLLSRIGYGLIDAVGLGELVAADEDDYVNRAIVLSGQPERLRQLRRGLRARMAASPLRDEAAFARAVENAFMAMIGGPERS